MDAPTVCTMGGIVGSPVNDAKQQEIRGEGDLVEITHCRIHVYLWQSVIDQLNGEPLLSDLLVIRISFLHDRPISIRFSVHLSLYLIFLFFRSFSFFFLFYLWPELIETVVKTFSVRYTKAYGIALLQKIKDELSVKADNWLLQQRPVRCGCAPSITASVNMFHGNLSQCTHVVQVGSRLREVDRPCQGRCRAQTRPRPLWHV